MRRTGRTFGERIHGRAGAYRCSKCGLRRAVSAVKHCWRCGTDLDRRKRQQFFDYAAAALGLWPYSCRRCGVRRYRWGKKSG
ncbi:MAG TPA: hypothetical protein VN709_12385 [Terriglobales bacterium]|nr:hypothetical protein [Terriglobales bacterium]